MSQPEPNILFLLFHYFLAVSLEEVKTGQGSQGPVVEMLRQRDEDDFLVSYVDDAVRPPSSPREHRHPKDRYRPGYVYLLEAESGLFKIGRTTNLAQRSKYFGLKLPFAVKLISAIGTYDAVSFEADLHNLCAEYHVNGEWFRLEPELVDFIRHLLRPTTMREAAR